MSSNLPKFIAIEKLIQSLGHGKVLLEIQFRDKKIVGITTTGNKRTVYNNSQKDINSNETAFEYILKRINQQLTPNINKSELTFRIHIERDKIRIIEAESEQTI